MIWRYRIQQRPRRRSANTPARPTWKPWTRRTKKTLRNMPGASHTFRRPDFVRLSSSEANDSRGKKTRAGNNGRQFLAARNPRRNDKIGIAHEARTLRPYAKA